MKHTIRCHIVTIPQKLRCELKITIDNRSSPIIHTESNDARYSRITFFPTVALSIIRNGTDESGQIVRAPWNPNDMLGMTKFNFPIFVNALAAIQHSIYTKKVYSYQGDRLEINEGLAEKCRKVFVIGNITVELAVAIVIKVDKNGNENRLEGIKMKFNNEESSVLLTLNEMDSLLYNLSHLDVDVASMLAYQLCSSAPVPPSNVDLNSIMTAKVDIKPLKQQFLSEDDEI